jgi:hypothetical protein
LFRVCGKRVAKSPFHRVTRHFAHLCQDMTVGLQREGDVRVAQHAAHDDGWYTVKQQEGGSGVPDVMRADIWQPCLTDEGSVIFTVPIARSKGRAGTGAEYEALRIPAATVPQAFLCLRCLVVVEQINSQLR